VPRQMSQRSLRIYQGTPVLDLDYARIPRPTHVRNCSHDRRRPIVRVKWHRGETPFTQDELLALIALAHRRASRVCVDCKKLASHDAFIDASRQARHRAHHPGKLGEMRENAAPHGIVAVSAGVRGSTTDEDRPRTFPANARLKAVAAAQAAKLPAFADDSASWSTPSYGAQGIYSARWAGPNKDFNDAMPRGGNINAC